MTKSILLAVAAVCFCSCSDSNLDDLLFDLKTVNTFALPHSDTYAFTLGGQGYQRTYDYRGGSLVLRRDSTFLMKVQLHENQPDPFGTNGINHDIERAVEGTYSIGADSAITFTGTLNNSTPKTLTGEFKGSSVLVTYSDTEKDPSSGQTLFSYTDHLRFETQQ